MRLTPRDDAGLKSARSPSGVKSASERHSLPPAAAAGSVRNRFVIGIFGQPSEAYGTVRQLPPSTCDVLVILGAGPAEANAATVTDGHVTIYHLDTSDALAAKLAAALAQFPPFAALGDLHDGGTIPPGLLQRPFQNLVHHLAAGSAVVIVHAPDSERQLQMSRALLEAKCDVLLTHDVVQAAGVAPPAHSEDCCDNCTSQACHRMDPHQNGTTPSNGTTHSKE